MKIIVLNGANDQTDLRTYTHSLERELQNSGHDVNLIHLAEKDIRFCTGCWTCWWKTPGQCVFSDDMGMILPEILHGDLVILITPVHLGLVSSLMKKTLDRTIPLLHPYMTFRDGETHHKKRYPHYPDIALIYKKDNQTDQEDVAFLKTWVNRYNLNFYADLKFFGSTESNMKDMVNEISRI